MIALSGSTGFEWDYWRRPNVGKSIGRDVFDMFAYIHGNVGAVHALGDDFAIMNKDTANRRFVRSKCQLGLKKQESAFLYLDNVLSENIRGVGESVPC